MTWMTTASGTDHSLSRASLLDAEYSLDDIAHAGAQINRYNGHTRRPMCINEHQLLCADIAEHLAQPPVVVLACLVHDAHEAYTGDTISPVKWALGHAWDEFETPIATHLRRWLGLHSTFAGHRATIRHIDLMALATERRDLLNYRHGPGGNKPWPILDTPGSVVPGADWISLATTKREQTHWTEWKAMWLERFHALAAQVDKGEPSRTEQPTYRPKRRYAAKHHKSILVYGPQGSGKTLNAEALRKHFDLAAVLDDWFPGQPWPITDHLVLSHCTAPDKIRRAIPIKTALAMLRDNAPGYPL